jgi:TolB protein
MGLALATLGASGQQSLTVDPADSDPSWSPDGQRIAFERRGQLWLIRPDGTGLTQLITPAIRAGSPTWSPAGERLAFTCEVEPGSYNICSISLDGTGFQRLTDFPGVEGCPDWSPDGSRIVFNTLRFSGRWDVAVLNLASRSVTRVIEGIWPAWSRDGTRIVLGIDGIGLATVQPDGSGLQVISHQGGHAPAWRP